MSLNVRYKGGPRGGKKNVMKNADEPPARIPVTSKECRGKGFDTGYYRFSMTQVTSKGTEQLYVWMPD